MLTLSAEQLASFQRAELHRFCRAIWGVWAATEGPRFPGLSEQEGTLWIEAYVRFCRSSGYDEASSIMRASLHALLAKQMGFGDDFVVDMLAFLVNRELPTEDAFAWVAHVLETPP